MGAMSKMYGLEDLTDHNSFQVSVESVMCLKRNFEFPRNLHSFNNGLRRGLNVNQGPMHFILELSCMTKLLYRHMFSAIRRSVCMAFDLCVCMKEFGDKIQNKTEFFKYFSLINISSSFFPIFR